MPENCPHTENDLLLQAAAGSEPAFGQLFLQHHQHLAVYIYKLTSSRDLAEEVVQEVFMKIWNERSKLKEVQNFRTWLFVISRNYALNAIRKSTSERLKQAAWVDLHKEELQPDDLLSDERFALAINAVEQLSVQQKKVFIMSRIKKMKYREIAHELNLSSETVKSYLKNAGASINKFVNSHSSFFTIITLLFLR